MTLLHHEALTEAMQETDLSRRLVVTPLLDQKQIGAGTIDLRLGTEFILFRTSLRGGVDPASPELETRLGETQEEFTVPLGDWLWVHPQQFVLGSTLEFLKLPPTMGGYVLGRSSWGRVGLIVATAVVVQPGFAGSLTLELVNEGDSPIRLYPGLRIAQLALHALPGLTEHGYTAGDGRYLSPTGPQAARLEKEREEIGQIAKLGKRLNGREPPTVSTPPRRRTHSRPRTRPTRDSGSG